MQDDFQIIPIVDLVDPPLVLREVDQRSLEYIELRDSLRKRGFLNSICVRPSSRSSGKFEVIDGRWRVAGAREVGLLAAPSIVKFGLTDKDVLAIQITANAARSTTQRSAFARQIRRLLSSDAGITQAEVCQLVNKGPRWVRRMLGVAKLSWQLTYRNAIDRGELSLEAAYYLAQLPKSLWATYATDAKVMPLREFRALCMTFLREHRAQMQLGHLTTRVLNVEPQPYMRSLTDVLDEIRNQRCGPLAVMAMKCKNALDGWVSALKWSIHLDPESVERQRRKIQQRLKKRLVKRRRKPSVSISGS